MRKAIQLGIGALLMLAIAAADDPRAPLFQLAQTSKKKSKTKKAPSTKSDGSSKKTEPGAADGGLKFSKDIAPILVANCLDCHNPGKKPGKTLDMTSFQKLMTGSTNGPVIVPGKPEMSPLVLHIKGEEEPKMPPNNRNLSEEAITRIVSWVKQGARLDAGVDPTAKLQSVAPSAEDLRRTELSKLTSQERDKKLEEVARERWKKASPKTTPEMTSGQHFVVFANMPKDRVANTLKVLEAQLVQLKRLLARTASQPGFDPAEKISVYIFNDAGSFAEFSRGVENREVEPGDQAHANLGVDSPYIAAQDPLGGREDESLKKRSRSRKGGSDDGGSERSLNSLLVEQLGAAATTQAGKAPRWMSLGMGALLAAQVEPRSPYFRRLREIVAQEYKLGWITKAQEALGDETAPEKVRALGFGLLEWLSSSQRAQFPHFVQGMLDGGDKTDDVIRAIWGADRQGFLEQWGEWVANRYGAAR